MVGGEFFFIISVDRQSDEREKTKDGGCGEVV
jgi:hypothetical protein